jgi:hypothetical protein
VEKPKPYQFTFPKEEKQQHETFFVNEKGDCLLSRTGKDLNQTIAYVIGVSFSFFGITHKEHQYACFYDVSANINGVNDYNPKEAETKPFPCFSGRSYSLDDVFLNLLKLLEYKGFKIEIHYLLKESL